MKLFGTQKFGTQPCVHGKIEGHDGERTGSRGELSQEESSADLRIMNEGWLYRMRHRQHVAECVEALKGYEAVHEQLELASEELRYAAKALGRVTGAIDIEHVLDAVFSEFCIGK